MNRIWLIAWREYRERVTKAPFLISTGLVFVALLAVPLIPLLFGQGRQAAPVKLLVLDATGGSAFAALQQGLAEPDDAPTGAPALPQAALPAAGGGTKFALKQVDPSQEASAQARVQKGEATGLLVLRGTWPGDLQIEYRVTSLFALDHRSRLEQVLTRAAQAERADRSGLDPTLLRRVLAPVTVEGVNLASGDRDRGTEAARFGLAMAAGMLVYVCVLASGAMLFQGVLEEKTSRVVEVLAASVRPLQMMAGKIIGLGLLGLTQYASWLLAWVWLLTVGYALAGDSVRLATPAFMLYLLLFTMLGYLLYAALFAAAGAMISRMEDSASVMMPVILPLMVPAMFSTFIVQNPESAMARTLSFIPLFTPTVMLNRIVMGHPAAWEIALSVALLGGAAVAVIWLAGRIYRASILTYGARPTLAQVWRYLHS